MSGQRFHLSPNQSLWLAQQLTEGVDYLKFGDDDTPQFLFLIDEAQWEAWLPLLPAPERKGESRFLSYREFEDGWIFQVGPDGVPVAGEFRFVRFCSGPEDNAQCRPCVEYSSGGYKGTRGFEPRSEEDIRTMFLELGFKEKDRHA